MTSYNGFSFTNESSGDVLHNPNTFLNPSNGLDDNDGTSATLSFTSTGTDTKAFGTTFSAKSIGACYVKVSTDLGANASTYVNDIYLQKYTGTTWVNLLRLKQGITQTNSFIGVVSNIGSVAGLRVYFDMTSNSGDTVSLTVTDFTYAQTFTYTPTLLLSELGGTPLEDRGDKTAISEDHTETWKALVNQSISIAESNVRTLQSNNIFNNGPNIVVDEMTDSTGTNNTINTGSTTCRYDSINDYYVLGINDQASGDTTHDPDGFTNPGNAFDGDDSTAATFTTGGSDTVVLGKTFASKLINNVYVKFGTGSTIATSLVIKLQTYNGSTWDDVITFINTNPSAAFTYETALEVNDTVEGIRVSMAVNGAIAFSLFTLEYGDYDSSSILVADTATTSLDSNEKGFAISVPDSTFPTNTSMTATISDGTNSLSPATIDTIKKGVVVGNDGTLSSGTLKVAFTLATTDTSTSPTLPSYGINILR